MRERKGYQTPVLIYLGGEVLEMDSTTKTCSLPSTCEVVEAYAQGQSGVYFQINGNAHNDMAPGYIPSESGRTLGPFGSDGLKSLTFWSTGSDVHICYYRQA